METYNDNSYFAERITEKIVIQKQEFTLYLDALNILRLTELVNLQQKKAAEPASKFEKENEELFVEVFLKIVFKHEQWAKILTFRPTLNLLTKLVIDIQNMILKISKVNQKDLGFSKSSAIQPTTPAS